jgi:hypothetical protein
MGRRGLGLFREGDFPFCTLTFVRNLPPADLLTRMRVDPADLALRDATGLQDDFDDDLYDDDEPVVTTGIDGLWTWAWEQGGMHGLDEAWRVESRCHAGQQSEPAADLERSDGCTFSKATSASPEHRSPGRPTR